MTIGLCFMMQFPKSSKVSPIRPNVKPARPVRISPQKGLVHLKRTIPFRPKMAHNHNEHNIVRRQGNYSPTIWQFDYIQSLTSKYEGESCIIRVSQLKEDIRMILAEKEDRLTQLERIDNLQRLGISYHFQDEINKIILESRYPMKQDHLHGASLEFRLMRQYGHLVSPEIFTAFKDGEKGNFMESLCEDMRGMLSLHEATFHMSEGEDILEEARQFSTKHLQEYSIILSQSDYLGAIVRHQLEFPRSWRMKRLEARWFIDVYRTSKDMNPSFLELAKFDFNVVQSVYLEDMKHVSRWWNSIRLAQKLEFSRDRVLETFLWSVGGIFEPQFGYGRRMVTRCGLLVGFVDDIYDVYGTLDELELFQDAIERWDINDIDHLPEYMKLCYFAIFNTINDMAYDALKEQGILITKYLKKSWVDLCKSYMVEARWFHSGYTPSLHEYMENATISIAVVLLLVHTFCFITNPIKEEEIEYLIEYPNIIRQSSLICRLADDLGTSSAELERGDNPKSIQCYMHETGVSEDEAREYIKHLIDEMWNKLNKERYAKSPLSSKFVEAAIDVVRMAMCMYEHGDGHGVHSERDTKKKILSILIDPIPLEPQD